MITYKSGSIFDSTAQVLVNPVNCMGISGAGLAKEFKSRFRAANTVYEKACKEGKLELFCHHILIVAPLGADVQLNRKKPAIAYFPTKFYYWDSSRVAVIEKNLRVLIMDLEDLGYTSVAIPAVGCGLGNLSWEKDVQPLMEAILGPSKVLAEVYPPVGEKASCLPVCSPQSTSKTSTQTTT